MTSWKPASLRLKPFGSEYDKDLYVESRTSSQHYVVNLYRYTCTCPDYRERRSQHPLGHLGRSCKHLRDTVLSITANNTEAFGDELTRVIFKSSHGPYDRIWFAPGPNGEILALGVNQGKPWVNIFFRAAADEPYSRYGYHLAEKRWAYDSSPPDAGIIEQMLESVPAINPDDC